MSHYLRKILLEIPPYVPGRSIEAVQHRYGVAKVYKLASNENPLGPSPKGLMAIKKNLKNAHRYPDVSAKRLKGKLAQKFHLTPEHFLTGNGVAEIIDLVAWAFVEPGDEIVLGYPTFPKYSISVRRMKGKIQNVEMKDFHHDVPAILRRVKECTKLIFLDNPNNPVGCKLSKKDQEGLIGALPDRVLLILDESYRDFLDENDCLPYREVLTHRKNILFLRSFSKGYGLAGLRIGYAIGNPDIIRDLNRVREVFNTNSLALAAAEAALDDDEHLEKTILAIERGKQYLYHHLKRLHFDFQYSFTNFIFVNTHRDMNRVDDFLLRCGIIIRPIHLKGYSNSYMRVTIGKPVENRAFISAMEKVSRCIPELEEENRRSFRISRKITCS